MAMPPRSRLSIAKNDIVKLFEESSKRVFARADLEQVLGDNRGFWRLAQTTNTHQFVEFLLKNSKMQRHKFDLPHRPTDRYSWGEVPTYEIVQSLRPTGYFTHLTAIYLHGLTEQIPKTIYLNYEQQASGGGGTLTQPALDRAFKSACRVSKNVTIFREQQICVVNGQNTGQLGVTNIETADGSELRVSDVERTLIDATVRPVYAGGMFQVAEAFATARDRVSINRLVAYLRKLNFTYPYHQAIGYLLQRTGLYSEAQLDMLRQFEMEFDFYLTHAMKEMDYAPNWRLFVPKGF
jgi:predicted transcriptional regulator of viral defense system